MISKDKEHRCPHCAKSLSNKNLIKTPDKRFSVSQRLNCPHCFGKVERMPPLKKIAIAIFISVFISIVYIKTVPYFNLPTYCDVLIKMVINGFMAYYVIKIVRNASFTQG